MVVLNHQTSGEYIPQLFIYLFTYDPRASSKSKKQLLSATHISIAKTMNRNPIDGFLKFTGGGGREECWD